MGPFEGLLWVRLGLMKGPLGDRFVIGKCWKTITPLCTLQYLNHKVIKKEKNILRTVGCNNETLSVLVKKGGKLQVL